MKNDVLGYLHQREQNVIREVSKLLTAGDCSLVACNAFEFHFKQNKASLTFQKYYFSTIQNHSAFLAQPDFFHEFKHQYSLQGIDGSYLDHLESHKSRMLQLLISGDVLSLYLEFFDKAPLKHKGKVVRKTLGSFFAKLVHTFMPDRYCALDNPIKENLGLKDESFFMAFMIISQGYCKWASMNPGLMQHIRGELEKDDIGRQYSSKMTNLKLLDMIFWHRANVIEK